MGNLMGKLESPQKTDTSNQSSIGADTGERLVDQLQSLNLLVDNHETNAVDEHYYHHHHHESLDVERLESSSSPKLQLNISEDDLDVDCLLKIFSYLSITDMIQVKRVCKHWYQASQQWFEQLQILDYDRNCWGEPVLKLYNKNYKDIIYEKDEYYGFKDQISILKSCGHHIKYYTVNYFSFEDDCNEDLREKFLFQWVPKLCKNIMDVGLYIGADVTHIPSTFKVMATHWKKLEKLRIGHFPRSIEKNFFELLSNNKQLNTLRLRFNSENGYLLNDKFILYLPTTIEKLALESTEIKSTEELSHFISASKNFTSLQSLDFTCLENLTDAIVAAIADIKSLTHLKLYSIKHYESLKTIDQIAKLKGLKSLDLTMNDDLREVNVINIVESCIQLEALAIFNLNDYMLSDEGMAAIAKLKKLKWLFINMNRVSIESIINLCNSLEVLMCYRSRMNDRDAIKLLEKQTNLRYVQFSRCTKISKNILQAANRIANERMTKILCITGFFERDSCADIDTPYFKYFAISNDVPLKMYSEDIIKFIKSS